MKKKVINHVFAFTIIVLLTTFFIVLVRNSIASVLAESIIQNSILKGIINVIVIVVICIPLILKFDLKESIGFNTCKSLYIGFKMLSILIFVGLFYSGIIYISYKGTLVTFQGIGMLFSLFFMMLTVGVMEEFGVRGILLQIYIQKWGKNKKGVVWAAFLSSFVFGFQHVFSTVIQIWYTSDISHEIIWQTIFHVFITTTIGFLFAIVLTYKKNIWIIAIVHGVYDFLLSLQYVYLPPSVVYTVSLDTAFYHFLGENNIFDRGNAEVIFFSVACIIEVIWSIFLCLKMDDRNLVLEK